MGAHPGMGADWPNIVLSLTIPSKMDGRIARSHNNPPKMISVLAVILNLSQN